MLFFYAQNIPTKCHISLSVPRDWKKKQGQILRRADCRDILFQCSGLGLHVCRSFISAKTNMSRSVLSKLSDRAGGPLSLSAPSFLTKTSHYTIAVTVTPSTYPYWNPSLSDLSKGFVRKMGKSLVNVDNADWGHVSVNHSTTGLLWTDWVWRIFSPGWSLTQLILPLPLPHSARLPPIRVEESSFSQDMQWLLERGVQFADVAFYAGDSGKELGWAHAAVLCAVSPYFRQLLLGPKTR